MTVGPHGLHVERTMVADRPVLLYVHGGPGQGSYEFMAEQRDLLGRRVSLIAFDQRGVLRSAPHPDGVPLTISDLVDDIETIREAFGIVRWAVLGQSFGGLVALEYAVRYPERTIAVAFENPTWDLRLTCGSVLQSLGVETATDASTPELWTRMVAALADLGEEREAHFIPDEQVRSRLADVRETAPFPAQWWERAVAHADALLGDDDTYRSRLPLLSRLEMPALLVKGGRDPIPSQEEVARFRTDVQRATVIEFADVSHFVQAERPEEYADVVATWLITNV